MHTSLPSVLWPVLCAGVLPSLLVAQDRFREVVKEHLPSEGLGLVPDGVADFDGDGREDHLALVPGGLGIVWTETDGRLTNDAPFPTLGRGRVADSVIADFDADGHSDILLVTGSAPIVYFGQVGRSFRQAPSAVPVLPAPAAFAAAGDFDGDGRIDLLFTAGLGGVTALCAGDGAGGFVLRSGLTLPERVEVVAAVDLDRDGNIDLVANDAGLPFELSLHFGDGAGNFTRDASGWLPARYTDVTSVLAVDLDGDADIDLVVGRGRSASPATDVLLLNDAGRGFRDESRRWASPIADTRQLIAADLDGDGDPDLAAALAFDGLRWWVNDGAANFSTGNLPTAAGEASAVAAFDFDGDGRGRDLVTNGTPMRLLLNSGGGLFVDANPPTTWVGNSLVAMARVADFDGDGTPDLLVGVTGEASSSVRELRLLRGDGGGRFVPVSGAFGPQVRIVTGEVDIFDVDLDGDLDIVQPFGPTLWLNDGTGRFTDATSGRFPGPANRSLFAVLGGDFDGDGDRDLIFPSSTSLYFQNTGGGVFVDVSARLAVPLGGLAPACPCDVDGDGDLDIVGSGLTLNDGGFFRAAPASWYPRLDTVDAIAIGDFDEDGDQDVIASERFRGVRYLENLGDGRFADRGVVAGAQGGIQSLAVGDVDEDGHLDVLALPDGAPIEWWRGDGAGGFQVGPAGIPGVTTRVGRVVLADVDGDRALDALTFLGRNRVHANQATRLAAPLQARIGRGWELELAWRSVAAGAAQALTLLSPGRGTLDLGPVGVLRLDPAVLLPVGPIALDARGEGSLTVPVPASAALVGAPIFGQTVFVPSTGTPRLSNLMVETIL